MVDVISIQEWLLELLKLLKPPLEEDSGRKKKNRRDEPMWVIIHIYIEMSQGNCLYSYLKQTKMPFFFFYKLENRKWE
jgi:hypothetical protein